MTSALDQLIRDIQRRRDTRASELDESTRLIRSTTEKRDRVRGELVRIEQEYERTKSRIDAEFRAHENALGQLGLHHRQVEKELAALNNELEQAKRNLGTETNSRDGKH